MPYVSPISKNSGSASSLVSRLKSHHPFELPLTTSISPHAESSPILIPNASPRRTTSPSRTLFLSAEILRHGKHAQSPSGQSQQQQGTSQSQRNGRASHQQQQPQQPQPQAQAYYNDDMPAQGLTAGSESQS